MDTETLRRTLDTKKLYDLYMRKRTSFASQLGSQTRKEISFRLTHAILSCDFCMQTYGEFQISLLAKLKESLGLAISQRQSFQETMRSIFDTHEKAVSDLDATTDPSIRNVLSTAADANLKVGHTLLQMDELRDHFRAAELNLPVSMLLLSHTSLCDLFTANDSKTLLAIVSVLAKAAISLIPGASIPMLLLDLMDAVEARQKRLEHASDELGYLDDYVESSWRWCLLGQASIDLLSATADSSTDYETLLKSVANGVAKRFNEFLQQATPTENPTDNTEIAN